MPPIAAQERQGTHGFGAPVEQVLAKAFFPPSWSAHIFFTWK
jgi:hypothetical protein